MIMKLSLTQLFCLWFVLPVEVVVVDKRVVVAVMTQREVCLYLCGSGITFCGTGYRFCFSCVPRVLYILSSVTAEHSPLQDL